MNALVAKNRTQVAQYGEQDPFAAAAEDMGASNATYLKFNGNTGEFTYGAQSDELERGHQVVVDMTNMRRGWICWKDGEVADEVMTRIVDGFPPAESDLPDHGPYVKNDDQNDGWTEQAAVNFRSLTTGEQFTFKASSKSALRALGSLLKDFQKQYKQHPGELPVVEIDASSFTPKNKTWGKKYAPSLKIVGWKSEAELIAESGDDPSDYGDEPEGEEAEDALETEAEAEAEDEKPAPKAKPAAAAPTGAPRRRSF